MDALERYLAANPGETRNGVIAGAVEQYLRETGFWEDDGKIIIRKTQDVEPILEANKRLFNDGDGYSPSRELRRAASIPLVVVEQWMREGVDIFNPDHAEAIKRKLNSSEWAHLRTAPGRL